MGEKVYRPILEDGDHLLRSSDNPDRVRGLSRDMNNQNPGIPEWEEVDLDELRSNESDIASYDYTNIQLTSEQDELGKAIVIAAAAVAVVKGGEFLLKKGKPLWEKKCLPWLKQRKKAAEERFGRKATPENNYILDSIAVPKVPNNRSLDDMSVQIDDFLDPIYFDMTEAEFNTHVMRLIYYMLGVVNEIRIINNARISSEYELDELRIERQRESDRISAEKVTAKLDQLLSNKNLRLDLNTSREIFELTGGGVWLNNEYVPVQPAKIDNALKSLAFSADNQ